MPGNEANKEPPSAAQHTLAPVQVVITVFFLRLQPIRGCVLGPPAVGKTHVVSQLCRHYKLHHITTAGVIKDAIERLVGVDTLAESPITHHTKVFSRGILIWHSNSE